MPCSGPVITCARCPAAHLDLDRLPLDVHSHLVRHRHRVCGRAGEMECHQVQAATITSRTHRIVKHIATVPTPAHAAADSQACHGQTSAAPSAAHSLLPMRLNFAVTTKGCCCRWAGRAAACTRVPQRALLLLHRGKPGGDNRVQAISGGQTAAAGSATPGDACRRCRCHPRLRRRWTAHATPEPPCPLQCHAAGQPSQQRGGRAAQPVLVGVGRRTGRPAHSRSMGLHTCMWVPGGNAAAPAAVART